MIEIKSLSFHYQQREPVLEQCNLQMAAGGVYGVLGTNGVGKTTLLHLLGGYIFPKNGQISVNGHLPHQRDVAFLQQVSYVPSEVALPNVRVSDYALYHAPFYPKFDYTLWNDALKTFGVDVRKKTEALSFGQKKKMAIAFALATQSAVLLLDEPTDGLDIPSKDSFRRLLSQHLDETRIVVITTHHIHDVATLIDHLVILDHTRVAVSLPLQQLSEQMRTATVQQLPATGVLYSEQVFGGYQCLLRNEAGESGPIDLELVFKAFLSQPQTFA